MKKISYLTLFALLVLIGCNRKLSMTSVERESFDEFYDQFHADQQFQLDRVQFPLEGGYEGPEGSREWTKESWQPHKQKLTEVSEPYFETKITRYEDRVVEKLSETGTGYATERRFRLIDGKWYLVYYETVDL